MQARKYLPSNQFSGIVGSITLALLLVSVASYITHPHYAKVVTALNTQPNTNWAAALNDIQAEQSVKLPNTPSEQDVEALRQSVVSNNTTDSVARTLFVNLSSAKSQGLGDDIPTQDGIISSAVAQAGTAIGTKTYTLQDLTTVDDSKDSQEAYGNALAKLVVSFPGPDYGTTMVILDDATSKQSSDHLDALKTISKDYASFAQNLIAIPVPKTFAPFHLQLVNNFYGITKSYYSMQLILSDPLQGLAGVQTYKSLSDQTLQVFINIARSLKKDGILFTKDEPGYSWSGLLSGQ